MARKIPLSQDDKYAAAMRDDIANMRAAQSQAIGAVRNSKDLLATGTGSGHFQAKQTLSDPFNTLQKLGVTGEITRATRGKRFSELPTYGEFAKYHILNAEFTKCLTRTQGMKSALGKALTGDRENVGNALKNFSAKYRQTVRRKLRRGVKRRRSYILRKRLKE